MRLYIIRRGDSWDHKPIVAEVNGGALPLVSLARPPGWSRAELALSLLCEHLRIPEELRERTSFRRHPSAAHRRARRLHLGLAERIFEDEEESIAFADDVIDKDLLLLRECWAPGDLVWVKAEGRWQAGWVYGAGKVWVRVSRVDDQTGGWRKNLKRMGRELMHRAANLKGADRPDRLATPSNL